MKTKRLLKRGVALATLLILTITAFIVPTSAKAVTETFEAEKDSNGYYYSIYEYAEKYGDDILLTVYADIDAEIESMYGYACSFEFDANETFVSLMGDHQIAQGIYLYNCTIQEFEDDFSILTASVFGDGDNSLLEYRFRMTGEYGHPNPVLYITAQTEAKEAQTGLIQTMFDGFKECINGFTNGIKNMFNSILFVDGTASSGVSHFAKFGFLMGGITLALGLGYVIINKLR